MKNGYKLGIIAASLLAFIGTSSADELKIAHGVMTAQKQEAKTPQQALQSLKDGNQRFIKGELKNRNLLGQAHATTFSQHPTVVILNCMDARTPPEIIFDQGIGDVFAARIAGNLQNNDILGSMEFGTKIAGAKLIAVIGHTNCGAVRGACNHVKLGHLSDLLAKIEPAVSLAAKELNTKDCANEDFIDQIAKDNVLMVMKDIQANSTVLRDLITEGKLGIVGGIQDLATGKVSFFDEHNIMPPLKNNT